MASPDIFAICEEVLGWIDADPTMHKDQALWRPPEYERNTVYCYPDDEDHTPYEAGHGVRQNYRLVLDVVIDDQGEQAKGIRDPAVTATLRAKAIAYAEAVRQHQSGTSYDTIRVAGIRWQDLNGLDYRGARFRLAGYKLQP